jgi:diguanylate cyclase (GGDEF)-like protein
VVVDGQFAELPLTATLLATLALLLGGFRAAVVFREHRGLVGQMRTEARHDHLTGLPNRRALMEELPAAIATGERLRLVLCDLNGFKAYNDTRGHQEGDLLLARLADRLGRLVAGRGRAYRLGGDEFCVVWPLTSDLQLRDVEHALAEPSSRAPISAACGEVEIPVEAPDVDAALRMADVRMYARKSEQRTSAAAS